MCDTVVALGSATTDGSVILAKNSDRQPNEAQTLTYIPRTRHAPGSQVKCTYVQIPQVAQTYEVILSRPFWMWGAEMGANEHGLAIGNEAVFTKEPYNKEPGLLGMDMLRLALERCDSARKALDLIVELLRTYGQSGNCGFRHAEYYHNSFILADPGEAWVLETAGKYWAAERVRGVRSISNGCTIGAEWDLACPDLVEHAVERGWCRSSREFHFARCYSDLIYTNLDGCKPRQQRSAALLSAEQGHITPATLMGLLRDHGPRSSSPSWNPGQGVLMDQLCVHAGLGPTRPSQTAGSLVAHLDSRLSTYWLTGTAAPCTGVFKPVYLGGAGQPEVGPEPSGSYDAQSLWWQHERLHRLVIRDYAARMTSYRTERDALESQFVREAGDLFRQWAGASPEDRHSALGEFSTRCFATARLALDRWRQAAASVPVQRRPGPLFAAAWNGFDKAAGLPSEQA